MSAPRVLALDAVRGIAIISVIASHVLGATVSATGSGSLPPELEKVLWSGQFGVQVFFALSGWLIFSLYWDKGRFNAPVYWSRRLARIWPLWAVFVTISVFVSGLSAGAPPQFFSWLLCLVFLGWLSPFLVAVPPGGLTIQLEMGHYLLFSMVRQRSLSFISATVVIGYLSAHAARLVMAVAPDGSLIDNAAAAWVRLRLFDSWPFFLMGGASFLLWRAWGRDGVRSLIPEEMLPRILLVAAVALFLVTGYGDFVPDFYVLGFVVAAVLLAVLLNSFGVVGTMLRSIGRYSYFMYFFHFWVLEWIVAWYPKTNLPEGAGVGTLVNMTVLLGILIVTTAVSWAVGLVSWNLLEKRILAIAHRTVPSRPGPLG